MKILITGGSGFIGSTVVRLAIKQGHEVVNVDALTYAAAGNNLKNISELGEYYFEHADIRDSGALREIIWKHKPDALLNLAAESHVDRSISGSRDFIDTNIIGTYNLLEVARDYYLKNDIQKQFRFIHISTDEVFGSLNETASKKFTEVTPYDPRSPYSASKASSDHLVRAWHETYDLPTIVTNCSNNYGPYHYPEKLIPLIITNALLEQPLPIYGDGANVRDWLYVEDHAEALLLILKEGQVGSSYVIGGNNEVTNLSLVENICQILDRLRPRKFGRYGQLISFVPDRPGHDLRYAIDAKKIKNELGWRPFISLQEGLEKTVLWYLENENWWRPLVQKSSS